MTGAESLLRTLVANGVDTCFMNPGTSEMHFVAALERVPGMRGILCLFEGVCSAAADGYARVLGRPAATLLHLGPGLANGLANFHNARKARTPVVSIVGEHATPHLAVDAPLTADIQAFARAVSAEVRTARSADDVGLAVAETVAAAWGPPGQVAMVIIPADHSWSETSVVGPTLTPKRRTMPSDAAMDRARAALKKEGTAILLGGTSVNPRAIDAAARTGARVMTARNVARFAWGRGYHPHPQVPYFPEGAMPFLADVKQLILVESEKPVSFFAYPNIPSYMVPDTTEIVPLARRDEDGTAALLELAAGKPGVAVDEPEPFEAARDDSPLNLESLGRTVAALLPEGTLISDEMVSSGGKVLPMLQHAAPHESMPICGGSIGQGMPLALGAAIAAPDRKLVTLEADGSGMYTLQALWTMARHNVNVTTVVFANRRYRILDIEMKRTGANAFSEIANQMIDIGNPALDWVKLSEAQGVPATRANTAREFTEQFAEAIRHKGPRVIEAVLI
ncbi:MAG: acetolactate synthase large subunit [Acidobacteriota bacterium]|nr:acetolactate synthase large subunit [Acidobacteriota bacterium]